MRPGGVPFEHGGTFAPSSREKGTDEVPNPGPARSSRRGALRAARRVEAPGTARCAAPPPERGRLYARLVDELWGERPPATAAKLVQGYVHALRKHLDADILVTQAPGYRLRVDRDALDLHEFQRLTEEARSAPAERAAELRRSALELWRGPPLADVVFEGQARHEVGRLSELHLATQIELLETELELGRHSQLVGELELLVAAHPYQERCADC